MYPGEPMTVEVRVTIWSRSVIGIFEMPKSSTFTVGRPDGRVARNRFAGLRSRWTMPSECASATASHASSTKPTLSVTGSGPRRSRVCARSCPSRYSMTMKGTPDGSVPTSSTRATCSLWMRTEARASRRKRCTISAWLVTSGRRNLSATRWSSCSWTAATTTPMPPWPSTRSTRYLPATRSPTPTGLFEGDSITLSPRAYRLEHGVGTGPAPRTAPTGKEPGLVRSDLHGTGRRHALSPQGQVPAAQ